MNPHLPDPILLVGFIFTLLFLFGVMLWAKATER